MSSQVLTGGAHIIEVGTLQWEAMVSIKYLFVLTAMHW